MEWTVSTVARAREEFLASGRLLVQEQVPDVIVRSWQRCSDAGLRSDSALPRPGVRDVSGEGKLVQAARQVLHARGAALADYQCAVILTAEDGRVLLRSADDHRMADTLDEVGVFPGCDVSEGIVGTASIGILIETGYSVLVRGPEHFAQQAQQMSSAAAYVRHPVTRRKLGTVSIVTGFVDTSPLVLSWTRELAHGIEEALREMSSASEQALYATYMSRARNGRQPIVCLDERTLIGNAASVRLLGGLDQNALWEFASGALAGPAPGRQAFEVVGHGTVLAECEPIESSAGAPTGALIRFGRPEAASRSSVEVSTEPEVSESGVLASLVGRSEAWRAFCAHALETWDLPDPMLLMGEPGTGRSAVVEALTSGMRAVRCATADGCAAALQQGVDVVVVERVEDLEQSELDAILRQAEHTAVKVVGVYTLEAGREPDESVRAASASFRAVRVPSLNERRDDIAALLGALSAVECGRRGPHWLPEVVTALGRIHWSRNVVELRSVVRDVLRIRRDRPDIRMCDLPADIQVRSSRRVLSRLEQCEAVAIIEAMRDADGNKKLAAESLGVARSTLYRKARALGLDIEGLSF